MLSEEIPESLIYLSMILMEKIALKFIMKEDPKISTSKSPEVDRQNPSNVTMKLSSMK